MKTALVYKSKSGFTKSYVDWLKEEIEADVFDASFIEPTFLMGYDTIIYGAGMYAVGIAEIRLIKHNLDLFEGKNIIVFACGASPARPEIIDEILTHNFNREQEKKIKFFYLRGGFDYSKLGFKDKILMSLLKFKLKRKKTLTADERGMLNAYDHPMDFTRKENLEEMLDYIRCLDVQ